MEQAGPFKPGKKGMDGTDLGLGYQDGSPGDVSGSGSRCEAALTGPGTKFCTPRASFVCEVLWTW